MPSVLMKMNLSVDHHHVLRDQLSVVLSDIGGDLVRVDLRMPGTTTALLSLALCCA